MNMYMKKLEEITIVCDVKASGVSSGEIEPNFEWAQKWSQMVIDCEKKLTQLMIIYWIIKPSSMLFHFLLSPTMI